MIALPSGPLLLDDCFNLPNFVLDFSGQLIDLPFSDQVGVVRDQARLFLDVAFQFLQTSCQLVLCALLHSASPVRFSVGF